MLPIDRHAHLNRWRGWSVGERALLALGLLGLALILPPWPLAPLIVLLAAGCAVPGAGIPAPVFLRALAVPAGFLLLGAVPLAFSLDAASGFAYIGWDQAARILARALAAAASLLLLAFTVPAVLLADGLRRLGLPGPLADLVLLIYRQILLLFETMNAMSLAQKARLGDMRRMNSLGLLAARLFPRALDRAERMERGVALRSPGGELRTIAHSPQASPWRLGLISGGLLGLAGLGLIP